MTSEEPTRLRDDANDAVLRRDLARARVRDASYDVGAGLSRFEAAIASGAPLPPDPGTASAGGSGTLVGWGVGTVLAMVIVALAVTQPWAGTPPKIAAMSGAPHEEPLVGAPAATAARDEAPSVAPPSPPTIAPATTTIVEADPPTSRSPRARARRPVEPATAAPSSAVDAEAEMKATRAAATALAMDPARALALVEAADRDFPNGLFGEDRRGIAALAELRLDRKGARGHADAYLRAHPKGTYAERLRRALGESPMP